MATTVILSMDSSLWYVDPRGPSSQSSRVLGGLGSIVVAVPLISCPEEQDAPTDEQAGAPYSGANKAVTCPPIRVGGREVTWLVG